MRLSTLERFARWQTPHYNVYIANIINKPHYARDRIWMVVSEVRRVKCKMRWWMDVPSEVGQDDVRQSHNYWIILLADAYYWSSCKGWNEHSYPMYVGQYWSNRQQLITSFQQLIWNSPEKVMLEMVIDEPILKMELLEWPSPVFWC